MEKKDRKNKKSFIVPFYAVLGILVVGVFATVSQTSHQQNFQSKAFTSCDVSDADLVQSANEKAMFDQINAYRQQNGKATLTWNDALKRPAKWLSNDASANNSSSQVDSWGRDTLVRAANCGATLPQNWGELIGIGPIDQAMTALESNSKDTLLNATVTQIAIGQTGNYWAIEMADVVEGGTATPTTAATIAPTFTTIGDCTTNNNCPTNVPLPTSTNEVINTVEPTHATASSTIALSPTPCPIKAASISQSSTGNQFVSERWGKRGGGWWKRGGGGGQGGLFQFLLILIEFLLRLLGGGKAPPPQPCAATPTPTSMPMTPMPTATDSAIVLPTVVIPPTIDPMVTVTVMPTESITPMLTPSETPAPTN